VEIDTVVVCGQSSSLAGHAAATSKGIVTTRMQLRETEISTLNATSSDSDNILQKEIEVEQ
jgi:hypothetical protein